MTMWSVLVTMVFSFVATCFASAEEAGSASPRDTPFSKKLGDGSALLLEKESHVELRHPPAGKPPGSPPGSSYETREFVIDRYRLMKVTEKGKEAVWDTQITSMKGAGWGIASPFVFWDAEQVGDKIYVLYSAQLRVRVDAVRKQASGAWNNFMSETIKGHHRYLGGGRFYRESGALKIKFADAEATEEVWEIQDGKLRKSASR